MSDPAPRANPPITIGPFANVPAPGSPIRSDWAQQITTYAYDLLRIPNVLQGAGDEGHLKIETKTSSVTTDAQGFATVMFNTGFTTPPVVIPCNAVWNATHVFSTASGTNTTFTVNVRYWPDGALAGNSAVSFNWIAIGRR